MSTIDINNYAADLTDYAADLIEEMDLILQLDHSRARSDPKEFPEFPAGEFPHFLV